MTPDQEPQAATEAPETLQGQRPRRGRGRGRRSHHGRRPRGEHPPSTTAATEAAVEAPTTTSEAATDSSQVRHRETSSRGEPAVSSVTKAIDEVNHIITTLKETLAEMEDVLETLELAERQKTADEQEIETLRRGLRQLHRPRDGGAAHNREQAHEPR